MYLVLHSDKTWIFLYIFLYFFLVRFPYIFFKALYENLGLHISKSLKTNLRLKKRITVFFPMHILIRKCQQVSYLSHNDRRVSSLSQLLNTITWESITIFENIFVKYIVHYIAYIVKSPTMIGESAPLRGVSWKAT